MIGYILVTCVAQVIGTWPMWGGDLAHSSVQIMRGAITSPVIKWRFATGWYNGPWQFSAIADCDGDGSAEVILGSWDHNLYCLNGSNGALEWSFTTGDRVYSSPAVADVDGDGTAEVVVGSWDHNVYCLRGSNGTAKWIFSTGNQVYNSAAIADVDGDGSSEVIIGSWDNKVYCLRGSDGTPKWEFIEGGRIWSTAAVADVDGDGTTEVVIGSLDDANVFCIRGTDGSQKWAFTTGNDVYSSPVLDDVNGDGKIEVVMGSNDNKIYCLRGSDGTQMWSFTTGGDVMGSPVIADCDGDGAKEVIIGSMDSKVYCLRGSDGTQKWSVSFPGGVHSPGALADIDGDGRFEFLVSQIGVSPDTLYCINAENGSIAWKRALAYEVNSPFAGDIDGDGCIEVIATTLESDPQGYSVFAIDDPGNTTNCGILYGDAKEGSNRGSLEFKAKGSSIYLSIPSEAWVSLVLYDVSGKLFQKIYEGVLSQGDHILIARTGAKGVYFAVLKYQGEVRILKVVR
ncbi:MAG: FG-GAP-like repeat-containing protein [candidate division WOR-3 bacterium]